MLLRCADKTVDLSVPRVMGVLNVTPDSFSDGGRFFDPGAALAHAEQMVEDGAAIIDVGGESTRPGAESVSLEEELRRVIPIVEYLAPRLSIPISVDTSKPEVMRAAVGAGAGMINDVYALRAPGALDAVAVSSAAVCLMHMQGEPRTMQHEPHYADVVGEVRDFLAQRMEACLFAGVGRERICIDPGFGFGKNAAHNLTLLNNLSQLRVVGAPILAGLSRKSIIGAILGKPVNDRLAGSLALATIAVLKGALLVRAHDVAQTVDAVRVAAGTNA